jgi:molybdopterin-guanine dinucleotide biosynthesis protein A
VSSADNRAGVIAAAILTGGLARRFEGRDKSRLPAFPGGPSILDHLLTMLGPIASEILIVTSRERAADFTGRPGPPPVRVVVDRFPGTGPIGAIVTALDAARAPAVFVAAGDMPGLTAGAIAELARLHGSSGADATVPESARGLEPLAAIYAAEAKPALAAAIGRGDLSLQRALDDVRLNRVPASTLAAFGDPGQLFRKINTPRDL